MQQQSLLPVPSKLRKKPRRITQAEQVLSHLRRKTYITDVEASGLYGIGQVARVVWGLKKKGFTVESTNRPAVKEGAAYYTEYRLIEG